MKRILSAMLLASATPLLADSLQALRDLSWTCEKYDSGPEVFTIQDGTATLPGNTAATGSFAYCNFSEAITLANGERIDFSFTVKLNTKYDYYSLSFLGTQSDFYIYGSPTCVGYGFDAEGKKASFRDYTQGDPSKTVSKNFSGYVQGSIRKEYDHHMLTLDFLSGDGITSLALFKAPLEKLDDNGFDITGIVISAYAGSGGSVKLSNMLLSKSTYSPSSIPESSTVILSILSLSSLAARRRRL